MRIASLARLVRDVGIAEELAQDALVGALEQWPVSGVPDNPGAWLMTAAKRHGIDLLRHRAMQLRKEEELTREIEDQLLAVQTGVEVDLDDHIGDDLLRLVFIACHPLLSPDARAALTLKMLGDRSEEHTSELQSLMRTSYAVFCLKTKKVCS